MGRVIGFLSSDSNMYFYQVVDDYGVYKVSNLLKALGAANQADLDIINVSLGLFHAECEGSCRSCVAVNEVVDSGTSVVVAAGTFVPDEKESVFCPGLASRALTTGVLVPECSATPPDDGIYGVSRDWKPPGSLYVISTEKAPDEQERYFQTDNYCSYQACAPSYECDRHRREREWQYNPEPNQGKPDILAPGVTPWHSDWGWRLATGTSYSAAMTSGAVAEVLGELFSRGRSATPSEVKTAVKARGDTVSGSNVRKLNQLETFRALI